MSVTIPQFTTDVNAHQNLDNQPSLSATELKQAWDKPANDIKDYINSVLIAGINDAIAEMETIGENLNTLLAEKLDAIYPVGRIIISESEIDPAEMLGFGTWELVGTGRVEIGVDTNVTAFNEGGKTGGSFSKNLSASNIPTLTIGTAVTNITTNVNNNADLTYVQGTVVTGVNKITGTLKYTNNSQQAVDITPSYYTVYRYKRTA